VSASTPPSGPARPAAGLSPDPRGTSQNGSSQDADDLRRMAPTYIAVIVVEMIVLVGLWVFQSYFGAR
jgi:hypothetical protein